MPGPFRRFEDIPQYVSWGSYAVDVSWRALESTLADWALARPMQTDPDFQRAHVWTEEQQVRFVEHILRGGVSGRDVLWNCATWSSRHSGSDELVLVDGKQRLQAVRRFLADEIPAFGARISEYEGKLPYLAGPSFRFRVNELKTRKEVLQWYIDINRGGVVHTDEEIDKVRLLLEAEV